MTTEKLACQMCGAVFERVKKAGRKPKYCHKCSLEVAKATKNSGRDARRRATRVANCEYCGEEIPRPPRPNSARYCTPEHQQRANAEKYYADNSNTAKNRTAKWRIDNPERTAENARRATILRKYGMTLEQYASKLVAQGGKCAICKTDNWGGMWGVPQIDHDHETGKVRDLLCDNCNNGIGRFGDDPARLVVAAAYLRKWAKKHRR